MNQKITRSVILTLIFSLTFSALVFASSEGKEIDKQVDGINASIMFNSEKVKTGNNDFTIMLKDKNNQPISNAAVKVTVEMDKSMNMNMNMGDSKTMATELKESSEKGEYMGSANFTDKGTWNVQTMFTVNGKDENTTFSVDVVKPGPNWFVIGGFSGAIVLIIVIVTLRKKKTRRA
ncbi:FixH family protein [Clostridium sp. WILCCON 0269]|uniref:FixH family protein n=1 Tax=Candidatus Clostridium eludens TaxID=3381663 RepID=A0ABW8SQB0_9CLOT